MNRGLALGTACLLMSPVTAHALSCPEWTYSDDLDIVYQNTDVIFEGYAEEVEDLFATEKARRKFKFLYGKDYAWRAPRYRTRFRVINDYKRAGTRTIDIWQFEHDRAWGAKAFERNSKYVVLANWVNGRLISGGCLGGRDDDPADFERYLTPGR